MPEDYTDLACRLRHNDERAFHDLFVIYGARLFRFVHSILKDRAQSEDIIQETFIAVWQHRHGLNEQLSPEAYLFTTARHLTLNALRKQTNGVAARKKFFQKLIQHSDETEHTVLLNDLRRHTEQALLALPPQQQLVFRLSRFEGLSFDQISERMNISPNTVRNHLSAALKMMRTYINRG